MDLTNIDEEISRGNTRPPRARLFALCALLFVTGIGLAAVAGPPRLPNALPTPETMLKLLVGPTLPVQGVLLVVLDVTWVLWAWISISLVLQMMLVGAELIPQAGARVHSMRRVVDRISPPLVRRGVVAAFAVQVVSRGVPIAAAQTLPPVQTEQTGSLDSHTADRTADDGSADVPTYIVRPADTLWSIAERAYGSGEEYRRLVEANLGRSMADGQVFSARGVIQPGWRLIAPGATWNVQMVDQERWYHVHQGDTLYSIAESVLGDGSRWSELFALNYGATSADGAHILHDPNTIWPDLRLRLPDATDGDQADDPVSQSSKPVELQVATAPAAWVDPAPPSESPNLAALIPPPEAPLPVPTVQPLLRTPHAFQPVVLDPSDRAPEPSNAANGADAAPAPEAASAPSAEAASDLEPGASIGPGQVDVPLVPIAIGGLSLAGLAGLALGARKLRRLRPLPKEPESEVVLDGGFAEAPLAHDLTRGLHGVGFDPVTTLVMRLEQFLAEFGLSGVATVAVRHGRSSTTVTLRCGLAEQAVLLDLAPVFAQRLEAEVEALVSTDQDVLLRLVRLRKTRLLPTADAAENAPCLVPLGVLYDRQVFSVSWSALGHVLVVSLPGHGSDTILTSLVATATARRSPEHLRVWCIASARAFPGPLLDLPHLDRVIDPADDVALASAMADLRAEVDGRASHRPDADLLVAVAELTSLGEHASSLELLASRAAEVGVRLVVASSDPDAAVNNPLTTFFATRLVLRMQSEETSVALLGVADAAFLGGGGRLLLRLDGREPVELYGYQVLPEHLDRMVKVMRVAYPTSLRRQAMPPTTERTEPPPESPRDDPVDAEAEVAVQVDEGAAAGATEPTDSVHDEEPTALPPKQADGVATAPLQIFCFGSPRVECAGQRVWPRSGGDAKPWELVLYLACQPPEGVSREAVVQAMWPDDELMEDAGHRFRQLRYRLRRQLQVVPGAPQVDGVCLDRRELKLDPGIVYSDAQEFLMHVGTVRANPGPDAIERLERARSLYVGDLLDGPDARRYAWLDERDDSGVTPREHFRHLFQNASVRLAELYTGEGLLDSAVELYRELTEMDPADERLWLALFRLHAERRDRKALIAEEQRLRQTLRDLAEEMDVAHQPHADEPSRETAAEYRTLLASIDEREPAAV